MDIGQEVHEFENKAMAVSGLQWKNISICELGNQKIKSSKKEFLR